MATYCVTGGCGFIGSHLAERLLKDGHQVHVIDNLSTGKKENISEKAHFHYGDIVDRELVSSILSQCDGAYHLAAAASVQESIDRWEHCHQINGAATINIFDLSCKLFKTSPIPVVYASSAAIYGDNDALPLVESAEKRPLSPYGIDKYCGELEAQFAGKQYRLPSAGLRFFNVFGERQDPGSPYSGVISVFVNRLMQGLPITVFGDGLQERDFIYVGDVVEFLVRAMKNPATDAPAYNVCTGQSVTLLTMIEVLGQIIGIEPEVHFTSPRSGDIKYSQGSNSKILAAFGEHQFTSLQEGLTRLVNSLR